jgi:hypothetical protein
MMEMAQKLGAPAMGPAINAMANQQQPQQPTQQEE